MTEDQSTRPLSECSSSEEDFSDRWVPYRDRPEWKDVKPVPLDEGPFPVVAIAYSDRFRDVFNYFRAIVLTNELSERALQLTTDALELNPANYTVWQYRRILLKAMGKDIKEELSFLRSIIEENPKNYQVWHHRRVLVEWMSDPSCELRLTEIVLSQDAKNYHAWQHRQWVLDTFHLFDGELDFVDRLLDEDVRNNSAWNQRFFVVKSTTGFTEDAVNRELRFCSESLQRVCNNESAWNYLRGILATQPTGLNGHPVIEQLCEILASKGEQTPLFTAFLVDRLEEQMRADEAKRAQLLPEAEEMLMTLATKTDPIRREYWLFLSRYLCTEFAVSREY